MNEGLIGGKLKTGSDGDAEAVTGFHKQTVNELQPAIDFPSLYVLNSPI